MSTASRKSSGRARNDWRLLPRPHGRDRLGPGPHGPYQDRRVLHRADAPGLRGRDQAEPGMARQHGAPVPGSRHGNRDRPGWWTRQPATITSVWRVAPRGPANKTPTARPGCVPRTARLAAAEILNNRRQAGAAGAGRRRCPPWMGRPARTFGVQTRTACCEHTCQSEAAGRHRTRADHSTTRSGGPPRAARQRDDRAAAPRRTRGQGPGSAYRHDMRRWASRGGDRDDRH